jgi:hypothetical protein
MPFLDIYNQYVLLITDPELIVFDVPSPQSILIVPEVVLTENPVIVEGETGVVKVQTPS